MSTKTVYCALFVLILSININPAVAQDRNVARKYEVGVTLANFQNWGMLYKVSRPDPNRFLRYELSGNIQHNRVTDNRQQTSASAYLGIGFEKRRLLAEKWGILHGFTHGISGASTHESQGKRLWYNLSYRLGYILGVYHQLGPNAYISVETSPTLSLYASGSNQSGKTIDQFGANLNFNAQLVRISAVYQLNKSN